jgi:hypothetical protein
MLFGCCSDETNKKHLIKRIIRLSKMCLKVFMQTQIVVAELASVPLCSLRCVLCVALVFFVLEKSCP